MNDSELDSLLKKARMPRPPEEFWEDLPRQMVWRLNRPPEENPRPGRTWHPRLAWRLAAAVCIIAAFAIGHWRGKTEAESASNDILGNMKFVGETLAMFPNQVRAIVHDDRGLNLVLSDNEKIPPSSPLYIRICDGDKCSSFVTFSGQEIQVAGQKLTVLSDAHGGIILEGHQFVWSSNERKLVENHLKIEAKTLSSTM
jgi:hypothetical protein